MQFCFFNIWVFNAKALCKEIEGCGYMSYTIYAGNTTQ